ncbi:hypothetical protein CEXT_248231 [Caerostris extrusa]|uniref:Uncharacterized protein n=1 Tax=Caerostris extrusa TaxID=172846 RepID=A0AAV4XVN9_CAEEX|nr:hypothetical protein CEXT_248231 [Caerostris extrusa]
MKVGVGQECVKGQIEIRMKECPATYVTFQWRMTFGVQKRGHAILVVTRLGTHAKCRPENNRVFCTSAPFPGGSLFLGVACDIHVKGECDLHSVLFCLGSHWQKCTSERKKARFSFALTKQQS